MNRTDRLLAIVLELQGKGRQRAEDLASTFETSKRTIYRDLQALGEAGVPLIATPGQGYTLMKGYFLPPLSFTTEEATMLLLGSDLMAQSFDAQYHLAALSASRKIAGALPEALQEEVRYLQSSIRLIASGASDSQQEREKLQQLRRAIIDKTTVRFHYYKRHSAHGQGEHSIREADPYGLINFLGAWHLSAYCHLRKDIRNFRLERIEQLEILTQHFARPADFHMHHGQQVDENRTLVAQVLFDHEATRWVRESRSYFIVDEQETADGLLVTLRMRHESQITQWLLSWGCHAKVLEPDSLRCFLREEAKAMLKQYMPED